MKKFKVNNPCYAVVGEFDNDEEVVETLICVAKTQKEAERIVEKADSLHKRYSGYIRARRELVAEQKEKLPRFYPRSGKLTLKDKAELRNEKIIFNEWKVKSDEDLKEFDVMNKPVMDDEEYMIIESMWEQFSETIWEGGFLIQEVELI